MLINGVLMKVIGLISDTHIPSRAKNFPREVFEVFHEVNMIIHAGDLTQIGVLEELMQIAPVVAVLGNMDSSELQKILPKIRYVDVYQWKIGVLHNIRESFQNRKIIALMKEQNCNVIVHGHTHRPSIRKDEKIIFINPGSPTNPLPPIITKPTVGLLKITREKIWSEIVELK